MYVIFLGDHYGSPYAIRPLSCQYPVCNIDVLWPYGGWIKMPFGTEIVLGPGNIVLDGDPAPPPAPERGTAARHFRSLQTQAVGEPACV